MPSHLTIKLEPVEARIMLDALLHAFEDMATSAESEGRPVDTCRLSHAAILAQNIAESISGYVGELEGDRDNAAETARGNGHG